MAKVYVDDVGTTLVVDTNIDLTSASTLYLNVLPPDLVEETWVCSDSGTPTDGLIDHQVGVDLDTMSQIEGHLRMHHHDGLVKKGKIKSRNL